MYDVKKELLPLAAKWRDVGIALGGSLDELKTIESSHPGKPVECLTEMLNNWLKGNYNFGERTWQKLVEVVAEPAGGNDKELAKEIAGKYQRKLQG